MGRVETFRQIRNLKRKYILSAVIFLMILIGGICAADYSVNNLIGDKNGIIVIKNYKTYIEIDIMNQKLFINTEYITRDLNKLNQEVGKLFGGHKS